MKPGQTRDERRRAERLERRDQRRLEDQAVELAVLVTAEREMLRRLEQRANGLRERRREAAPVRAPNPPDMTIPTTSAALEPPAAKARPRDRPRAEPEVESPVPRRNRTAPPIPARDRKPPVAAPPPRRSSAQQRTPDETPAPRGGKGLFDDDPQDLKRVELRAVERLDRRRGRPIDEPPARNRVSRAARRETREANSRPPPERSPPPLSEERSPRARPDRNLEHLLKDDLSARRANPPAPDEGARDRPVRVPRRRADEAIFGVKTRRRQSLKVEAQATLRATERKIVRAAQKAELFAAQTAPRWTDQDPPAESTNAPQSPEAPANLGRLRTSGGFIVDENGAAVGLRGVNVRGLDDCAPTAGQSVAQALSLDAASLTQLTDLWGVNLVRLTFQPQTLVTGTTAMAADALLLGVDDLAAQLADDGVYTLLALEPPPSNAQGSGSFPDPTTMTCWSMLAARYSDRPYVLFELLAPSAPSAPFVGDWRNAALTLVGIVRQAHPASLLFVGDGGATPGDHFPLRYTTAEPAPNLVYALRVGAHANFLASDEATIATFARSFPIVATDWSSGTSNEFDRSAELAAALFGRNGIGWAASSWNAEPRLVIDPTSENLTSTRWGGVVQRAMVMPLKLPLIELLPDETPS